MLLIKPAELLLFYTGADMHRLASPPSGVLHDISSAMYGLFTFDQATDQNGTALRPCSRPQAHSLMKPAAQASLRLHDVE
jgi:hypothetical protein